MYPAPSHSRGAVPVNVSFDESEIEAMADWFMANWDAYVGVSFLQRSDPAKTAEDLGFAFSRSM